MSVCERKGNKINMKKMKKKNEKEKRRALLSLKFSPIDMPKKNYHQSPIKLTGPSKSSPS
jgi:hypothetical protein